MTPIDVTNKTFEAEVLQCVQPVLVDFWAAWCGPCKLQAPIVDELCETRSDIKVCKVNVDEQFDLAIRYQVNSIPTLMIFDQGKLCRKAVGLREKAELEQLLEEVVREHPAE